MHKKIFLRVFIVHNFFIHVRERIIWRRIRTDNSDVLVRRAEEGCKFLP